MTWMITSSGGAVAWSDRYNGGPQPYDPPQGAHAVWEDVDPFVTRSFTPDKAVLRDDQTGEVLAEVNLKEDGTR